MANHWFSVTFAILLVVLSYTHALAGSESLFKLPCTISYNGNPPIETNCIVRSSMSQGFMVDTVQTPNGKTFILENDQSDTDKWYLNHQAAVKVSGEPNPCYQNTTVSICF